MSITWLKSSIKAATISIVVVAAAGNSAAALTFSEYICERYCRKLDPLLDALDERVRDWNARLRGDITVRQPLPAPGKGAACGVLPQQKVPFCCPDPQARLLIEYSGGRDPYVNTARYRLICRK